MLKNWIKIFLYQVKNNKLFTALNILGLSIGIAGIIFAILYRNDEEGYNAWNPEKDNVFQVINDLGGNNVWATNISQTGNLLKTTSDHVTDYCYIEDWYAQENITYKGKNYFTEKITDAQPSFFNFFPFEFIKGSAKNAIGPNAMAISEKTAKAIFGDEDPIGKEVTCTQTVYVIKGVYRIPGKSSFSPEVVTGKMDSKLERDKDQWGNFSHALLLKLKNPEDKDKVAQQVQNIYFEYRTKKYAKDMGITPEQHQKIYGKTKVVLEPLSGLRLHSLTSGTPEGMGNYQFLMIMVGLSVLILILSVVNYVNLATAGAIKRAKEVGVRKILGASKANVIKQFVFETVITAIIAILLALVIVELSLPYYNEFLGKELVIHGMQFYTQLVAIFVVVIIVAGIFPAVYVSNFETLKVLKGNFGRSKSGIWLRNGMLVLQFAIASFFITGSYIVYSQVHAMSTKDLGFKGDQILEVNYASEDNFENFTEAEFFASLKKAGHRYEMIKQELSKVKGVKGVSLGSFSFGGGANSSSGYMYKKLNIQGKNMLMDFNTLDMLGVKLKEGRNISPNFASDTVTSILINETAARMLKEKDILGKVVDWNDKKFTIIGIVKDFHVDGPQTEIPPMTFFHYKTVDWMLLNVSQLFVKIDPEQTEEAIAGIEKFWKSHVDSQNPFRYEFANKNFARTYENYVKQKNLFSLLNIVVILIALFGLFALASYSIQRRMKEIAIRKTLGAETSVLLRELSKQYVLFCLAGFVITIFPAYFLLNMWLENFAYRIDITVEPFLIGFVALLLLTLMVVLSRAYQATRIDVLKYLKYE
ncbi:multidrug ABC transporter substrate-binding protein [Flavobacterium album]|uniref:Multidrug ABC transporter substrate-binding protein n=1 Tax=Flavobacterium album TaxID=2175091 RepID=A0A2S1QW80_9FLAO|nr:ABC transporter permease [Flavobacterium album]AWH84677.1 multidrug ABC transporter substrate-binding protein [Flavobacterium album]